MDNNSPIVGDPDYGLKKIIPTKKINLNLLNAIKDFERQALHAISLGLIHPKTGQSMKWSIDLPEDMKHLLTVIRDDLEGNLLDDNDPFLNPVYQLNQPIDIDEIK
jgi:23S rRNA pseudouridine1911/1915/1917 synthase